MERVQGVLALSCEAESYESLQGVEAATEQEARQKTKLDVALMQLSMFALCCF